MRQSRNTLIFSAGDTLIRDALGEYVLALRAGRKSPRTIEFYQSNIERFIWWAEKNNICPREVGKVEAAHIRRFLMYLDSKENRWGSDAITASRKCSDTTISAYFRALRAFFNFCEREKFIQESPFRAGRISTPTVTKRIVATYTEQDITELLAACQSTDTGYSLRDTAILLLMLDTGIRASELCDLRVTDLERGRLKVLGKGAKERILPLTPLTEKVIRDYIRRGRRKSKAEYLFVNREGQGLTRNGLYQMVKRRCQQAGIEHAGLHKMRHTFTKMWVSGGGALHALQAMLGHESPVMTLRYGRMWNDDTAELHRQYSPVERLGLRVKR